MNSNETLMDSSAPLFVSLLVAAVAVAGIALCRLLNLVAWILYFAGKGAAALNKFVRIQILKYRIHRAMRKANRNRR